MDERLLDQELLGRDWPPATVAHGPCVRPSHGVAPTANGRLCGGATKGGGGPGPFQSWIVPTESFPVPYMKLFSGGNRLDRKHQHLDSIPRNTLCRMCPG